MVICDMTRTLGRHCRTCRPYISLCFIILPCFAAQSNGAVTVSATTVEQWDVLELTLTGPSAGNPFVDVQLSAEFSNGDRVLRPDGFHDGDGTYRIRFMPDAQGEWSYETRSNAPELDGLRGSFTCSAPSESNHGPVRVRDTWYLGYADGTPYFQVGTTCYAWAHQGDAMEEQTLRTLRESPFNKLRMCVFPKDYVYNKNEPPLYPFEGKPLRDWDLTRPSPAFWRHFEHRVEQLRDMGIEADIILFHPYDRWGYQSMDAASDDRYLRYTVARLAAYRNVWWSFANEFDFMKDKTEADWDRFFQIVQAADPYQHLRGIHNGAKWYDHTKPWVTHCSIQSSNFAAMPEWRDKYRKPILIDECRYEGDVPQGWGNLTAEQMARYFWLGTMGGCYVGHGETYKHPEDILWWSKGGVLHGQSPARIAFLKQIMSQAPAFEELVPQGGLPKGVMGLAKDGEHYLYHFQAAADLPVSLPGDQPYKLDGIDAWEMTVTSLGHAGPGEVHLSAPKGDYVLRLSAYAPGEPRRPEAHATCEPAEGVAPLAVKFAANQGFAYSWDFGDGATSTERAPEHTYQAPGLYLAALTVTDAGGLSATSHLRVTVDDTSVGPLVQVGFVDADRPASTTHGEIARDADGAYEFADGEPWRWLSVGDGPMQSLEGLRTVTIVGWAKPSSMTVGSGGNRIIFNLNYNRSGFDLVHLADGRLRLSVNEWPDGVRNDSSPGKLAVGEWTFFAVTYDATLTRDNVRWYFGDDQTPAELDRTTTYAAGATGADSGPVTVGNYNETLHSAGLDRQFRGSLRAVQVFGSRLARRGILPVDELQRIQRETSPGR